MYLFSWRLSREAIEHAMDGGQSLHVHRFPASRHAPLIWREAREKAHLFDQDLERLIATARRLGVRVIQVEYLGCPRQHIDLCGDPLERARAEARDWPGPSLRPGRSPADSLATGTGDAAGR